MYHFFVCGNVCVCTFCMPCWIRPCVVCVCVGLHGRSVCVVLCLLFIMCRVLCHVLVNECVFLSDTKTMDPMGTLKNILFYSVNGTILSECRVMVMELITGISLRQLFLIQSVQFISKRLDL